MAKKPWLTSSDLIESVKRKINFPVSQDTFTENDILKFANEEMAIAQVPSIMELHEEYFVYSLDVPIEESVMRYQIPDRAIGMKLRDVFVKDNAGNLTELYRSNPDDKAYYQNNLNSTTSKFKYYLEGNDIVLTQSVNPSLGVSLVFSFYLRPNQLVKNDRACTVTGKVKFIDVTDSFTAGDTVTINGIVFTASTSTTSTTFNITLVDAEELANAINLEGTYSAKYLPAGDVVTVDSVAVSVKKNSLNDIDISISGVTTNTVITSIVGLKFDQLPETYLENDTGITEDLYLDDSLIDYLQTKPGHKTYYYDQTIPSIVDRDFAILAYDPTDEIVGKMLINDYICLANESIIPQIPPDLHNLLAERTCARVLAAQGDVTGLQTSNAKIQEMEQRQGTLLDNRVSGSPQKVSGKRSLLSGQSFGMYNNRGKR